MYSLNDYMVLSFTRRNEISNYLVAQTVKNLPAMTGTQVQSLGREDPLEKGMATHFSILALRIPWMENPGGLQFTGSQRVGHKCVTNTDRRICGVEGSGHAKAQAKKKLGKPEKCRVNHGGREVRSKGENEMRRDILTYIFLSLLRINLSLAFISSLLPLFLL